MPELPEVETTRRGIAPHLTARIVTAVTLRRRTLRWPVSRSLTGDLPGQRIRAVRRRAKYLLIDTGAGSAIVHLGMSGSLRIVEPATALRPHDHWDMVLDCGHILRYNDPRRFGCLLWTRRDPLRHKLLADLGPEPLESDFDGAYLHAQAAGRRTAVKNLLMDSRVVAGLGNIYVSEALFIAGIHPAREAGRVSLARYDRLAVAVRDLLRYAIERGGTTLRDFLSADGSPGYFQLELNAYGREGEPCPRCGAAISQRVIGQRSTFYCARCQR